jgi:hypothetical protein
LSSTLLKIRATAESNMADDGERSRLWFAAPRAPPRHRLQRGQNPEWAIDANRFENRFCNSVSVGKVLSQANYETTLDVKKPPYVVEGLV